MSHSVLLLLILCLLVCAVSALLAEAGETPAPPGGVPLRWIMGNDVENQVHPIEALQKELGPALTAAGKQGMTSFEPYVKWRMLEPSPDKWDFSYYDEVLRLTKQAGMKWTPFLMAGPAYATPDWFKTMPDSAFARCLEHDEDTRNQSIWNPNSRKYIRRFLQQFGRHYQAADMESVLLGISGDFGEAIQTAQGNYWTYIWDGEYHDHHGWWAGDRYAVESFRAWLKRKYKDDEALRVAWGARKPLAEVEPFLPENAPNWRARLDFTQWYLDSMTDWVAFWTKEAKKAIPGATIYLCTGGDGGPALGGDFSAHCKVMAKLGGGVRITNEGSDFAANFRLTRWIASACRFYGAPFGFEPAGPVENYAIAGRMFNASTSGADHLFVYDRPPGGGRAKIYSRYMPEMVRRQPVVPTAVLIPTTSMRLARSTHFWEMVQEFRDYTDFDYVDEGMVKDGALGAYHTIVRLDGDIWEADSLRKLEKWIKKGGEFISRDAGMMVTVEKRDDFHQSILGRQHLPRKMLKMGTALSYTQQEIDQGFHQRLGKGTVHYYPDYKREPFYMWAAGILNRPDGHADGVFWTETASQWVILNYTGEAVTRHAAGKDVEIPAHGFVAVNK